MKLIQVWFLKLHYLIFVSELFDDLRFYSPSGFYALLLTAVAVVVALYQEVDLSYIHAHFLQFYTSSLLIVTLLSVYLFIRSRWASEEELAPGGNSGKMNSVRSFSHFEYFHFSGF